MEAKQQMIHISSKVAREKLPASEIAANISGPWPELLPPHQFGHGSPWAQTTCFLTGFSLRERNERESKRGRDDRGGEGREEKKGEERRVELIFIKCPL